MPRTFHFLPIRVRGQVKEILFELFQSEWELIMIIT